MKESLSRGRVELGEVDALEGVVVVWNEQAPSPAEPSDGPGDALGYRRVRLGNLGLVDVIMVARSAASARAPRLLLRGGCCGHCRDERSRLGRGEEMDRCTGKDHDQSSGEAHRSPPSEPL